MSRDSSASKHRGFVVDEGDGPVAGSGEGAQPLDLRGDGVTVVARLVHVEQVVVELDPHVSPRGVQRVQRVGAQRSGRLVWSPTKVDCWSWNQRITPSAPG
jgi:hypothetical protein